MHDRTFSADRRSGADRHGTRQSGEQSDPQIHLTVPQRIGFDHICYAVDPAAGNQAPRDEADDQPAGCGRQDDLPPVELFVKVGKPVVLGLQDESLKEGDGFAEQNRAAATKHADHNSQDKEDYLLVSDHLSNTS